MVIHFKICNATCVCALRLLFGLVCGWLSYRKYEILESYRIVGLLGLFISNCKLSAGMGNKHCKISKILFHFHFIRNSRCIYCGHNVQIAFCRPFSWKQDAPSRMDILTVQVSRIYWWDLTDMIKDKEAVSKSPFKHLFLISQVKQVEWFGFYNI